MGDKAEEFGWRGCIRDSSLKGWDWVLYGDDDV